ncbi:MAG: hypothetical protein KAG64_08490 [Bacteroidales bacterium]|nr:hypothetical protein [Bacteroidales bacterium]
MIKQLFILALFIILHNQSHSQSIYNTTNGEAIFGWSTAKYNKPDDGSRLINGNTEGTVNDAIRFTIWFHFSSHWHYDFSQRFGIYTGIGNRNIGFITKEMSTSVDDNTGLPYMVKWKRRSYALGIPLGIKIGNMDKGFYGFIGGQIEWLYHYKEKEFLNTGKRKYTEWISERTNMFLPSAFIGITFPHGMSLKFTYALNNFMNKSYTDSAGNKPYKDMDTRIMYVSFFKSIRWKKEVYEKHEKKH